ncbi:MAG: SGNH/GDSL hydrolase family protein, partial [Actinomycetota bacterium]
CRRRRSAAVPHAASRRTEPPGIVAVFWWLGWVVPAVLVALVSLALVILGVTNPDLLARIDARLSRFGQVIAGAVSAVLLGVVHAVVFLPAWLVGRLVRRDPLAGDGAGWQRQLPTTDRTGRPFSADPGREGRPASVTPWSVFRLVPVVAGWVVVALVADVVVGSAWDALSGEDDQPAAVAVAAGEPDPRADSPAYADSPWAEDYLIELASITYQYEPFVVARADDFSGAHIEITDGVRHSRQAAADLADAPTLWFFGGSTMWGEGQRDDHTIPSEIARLAADDGMPVRVVNYGERGYVSRQELELFDRELGLRSAPDLAVFYDGTNDFNVQSPDFNESRYLGGVPTVYDAGAMAAALGGVSRDERRRDLYERYIESSAAHEVWSGLRGLFGLVPAGASPAAGDESDQVERTVAIYERSRHLIEALAADFDVETRFYWQPQSGSTDTDTPYRVAADRVSAPTVDLSQLFAGIDESTVYIDGGHTNELGASMVAEAIWQDLRPRVAALGS